MAKRILIVEDDPDILSIERTLVEEELGLVVDEATTVQEAIAAATSIAPDLVILDLLLPDGDGTSVLTAMRKDKRMADVPVMVVTAMSGAEHRRRVLAAGATDVMFKPFDAKAFLSHVTSLLSKPTGTGYAAPSS